MVYIALLRGINVGAKNMIKMADLKNMFHELGYQNISTYVQSGNVVFTSDTADSSMVRGQIEEKLLSATGNPTKVIVKSASELAEIINNNPFVCEPGIEKDKLHVTFLMEAFGQETISQLNIKAEENSRYTILNSEVYLYCPGGYGRTKLTNNVFENKLKTSATTRNWNTVNNLLEMADKMANH